MKMKYKGLGSLRLGVKGESVVVRHNDIIEFGDDDNFPSNMFEEIKTTFKKSTKKVEIKEEDIKIKEDFEEND